MNDSKVVITGMGIVSPIGIGRSEFWNNLTNGKSGIRRITNFKPFGGYNKNGGVVTGVDFERYLHGKGLKYLDRTAKLLLAASIMGLKEVGFDSSKAHNNHEIDVAVGSDWGYAESNFSFHKTVLMDGPSQVSPMDFPNTIISSPGSQISLRYGLTGLNATLSRSFSSGIDAVGYAVNMIKNYKRKMVLVAAVENLCAELYTAFYTTRWLTNLKDDTKNINLGEGACALMLEDEKAAKKRKARIYASILGYGFSFGSTKEAMKQAINTALEDARVPAKHIDYICANFNGGPRDKQENGSINDIFSGCRITAVSGIKFNLGEGFGVASAFQVASSSLSLQKGVLPSVVNFKNTGRSSFLNKGMAIKKKISFALVNSFGLDGNNACLVLEQSN
jgi:3-oxoacyl-[acyl-carrier-protein] synthase II